MSGAGFEYLVSPFGVVSEVASIAAPRGMPELARTVAVAGRVGGHRRAAAGIGASLGDPAAARTKAIAEAAEAYVGMAPTTPGECVRSKAADLDGAVLDLARIPRCTAAEYAAPGCPVAPFDPDAVIRWTRGIDLVSGDPAWVPSIMAIYGLRNRGPGERFWPAISTGCAVHTDPCAAICAAVREVIERDIIEVAWSHRLALPPVDGGQLTAVCRRVLRWHAEQATTALLFDATSDMGVPTVYCLQIAESDRCCRQAVSCATGATLAAAAEKAVLDSVGRRETLGSRTPVKERFADFTEIDDGARYMGRPERASAFDFLVDGLQAQIPRNRPALPDDPRDQLQTLISTIIRKGMQAVAVDRTSGELAYAGLTAVCVVIPDLQPMSLHPLARYRGHPRLHAAPALMGYQPRAEPDLNPWPQPFA